MRMLDRLRTFLEPGQKSAVNARSAWAEPSPRTGAAFVPALGYEVGLITVTAAIFLFHLGAYGLWPDEARYAEVAREMLGGDLMVPHLNYVAYVEKPPLLYWATALSFRCFGLNELAARLPSAVFAILGVLAVYVFGRCLFDRQRALLAGAILATSPLYAVMAQVLNTDMMLTALVTVAMFAMFLTLQQGGIWSWLAYVAMGLGMLTKGLVALALPTLSAVVFLWWQGELREGLKRLHIARGLIVVALVSGWWFVLLAMHEPGFLQFYFIGEHVRRFFDSTYSHGGAFYVYLPILAAGMLPWSLVVAALLALGRKTAAKPALVFCTVAALTVVVFFSAARNKLAPYILPAIPPLALVIADFIAGCAGSAASAGDRERASRMMSLVALVLMAAGIGVFLLPLLAARLANPYLVLVRPCLTTLGLILFAGTAISAWAFRRQRLGFGIAALVATTALGLVTASYGRIEVEPMRSFAAFSREVAARAGDAQIVCYGRYVHAMPFYTRRRVILVGPLSELRFGAERALDASAYFFDSDAALLRLWHQPHTTVVILDQSDYARLKPLLGPARIIARARDKLAIMRVDGAGPNNPSRTLDP